MGLSYSVVKPLREREEVRPCVIITAVDIFLVSLGSRLGLGL